ncbi:hypothetical protein ABVT39_017831 [Epinephelus coioides]
MESPTITVVKWDGVGAMLQTASVSRVGMDKDGGVRCDVGCGIVNITLELLPASGVSARVEAGRLRRVRAVTLWCPWMT